LCFVILEATTSESMASHKTTTQPVKTSTGK
jgi:hypothetical protein